MSEAEGIPGVPDLSAQGVADIPPLEAPTLEPPPGSMPGDAPPSGRKRGRPAGSRSRRRAAPVEPPPPSGPTPEDVERLTVALSLGFDVVGNVLAAARGPHWTFSKDESATLGGAWAVALAPYMSAGGKYLPWALAAAATLGVIAPRVMQDRAGIKGPPAPDVPQLRPIVGTSPAENSPAQETQGGKAAMIEPPAADLSPPANPNVQIAPPAGRKAKGGTP